MLLFIYDAKNICGDTETEYTYDTTAELSRLLYKVENDSTVTKYIYGIGLIGEVSESGAKIYHFDYRGSTAAITDKDGEITDTFSYDTYGKLENRTGTSAIIFLYNGRDGVVTDSNGLLYMRARYYSPVLKRFVNADIIAGVITDPVTLNRYSYANGNPVSNIDPFGLSAERGNDSKADQLLGFDWNKMSDMSFVGDLPIQAFINDDARQIIYNALRNSVLNAVRPNNIPAGIWAKQITNELKWIDEVFGSSSKLAKGIKVIPFVSVAFDSGLGIYENIQNNVKTQKIVSDAVVDVGFGLGGIAASTATGAAFGTVVPGAGNIAGAVVGFASGVGYYILTDVVTINGKSVVDWTKEGAGWIADQVVNLWN